jgi:hypothetical protein
MKISFKTLVLSATLSIGFASCEQDPTDASYTIPTTYNFDNVSYGGQTDRLEMMGEITTYLKTANGLTGATLDANQIKDMYGDNTGDHFSTAALNTSTKQLKSKTISTETTNFMNYMDAIATASLSTATTASDGQAGTASNNSNSKSYLLNANGIELTQIIEKGLMGACFYYQATAVYLGTGKMNGDNTIVNQGEGTDMEHAWDEAFGYFGAPINFPSITTSAIFWGKYSNTHQLVYPLNQKLMDAFLKGRAAISAKDMTTRDEMIIELRKQWELITVATAIHYLNTAKINLGTDNTIAYHELSEVFPFIMSLKYSSGSGSITISQVNTILTNLYGSSDPLQANNYMIDMAKIEAAKTALVGYFTDLTSVKNSL